MKKSLLVIILSTLFIACTPSEQAIQTAIAETQAALPTNTYIPPTSTPTLTPTLTPTNTITPSPTPDLRVIKLDPYELMLSIDDLPPEGKYYLPNSSWISPHRNIEIIQAWGAESGQKYINETGRIDGWFVSYKRGSSKVVLPEEIYDNVIMYQTAAGAQLTVTKYSDMLLADNYAELTYEPTIGEVSRTFILREKGHSWYLIRFSYRNYVHTIIGYGLESEVHPDLIIKIAGELLDQLKSAPLSEP